MTTVAERDFLEEMLPDCINPDHQKKLDTLACAIVDSDLQPMDLEPNHYFAHGTYTRELFIPKGGIIAGKIHRYDCIAIIAYGHVSVTDETGSFDIKGPKVLVTGTGAKAVFAHEDTLWITVHPWSGEPDLKQIEDYVIVKHDLGLELEDKPCLGE